jgi:hypothetical protein
MFSIASRTAFAMSALRPINDWLSIALTFTVICGAGAAWPPPLFVACPVVADALGACAELGAACRTPLMATGGGGV